MSIILLVLLVTAVAGLLLSVNNIGPREYGLLIRRFGGSLEDNVVAFNNEAGYQADLLMPGQFRFAWWFAYKVIKLPWPSVPANQIGVVIAQVGAALKPGAKSAEYKQQFASFTDIRTFVTSGGQIGVQRPALPPGFVGPIHPVGFLVLTKDKVYGIPVGNYAKDRKGELTVADFGLDATDFDVQRVTPARDEQGKVIDRIGVVTALDGPPLESGSIACRLGGPTGPFGDIAEAEQRNTANDTVLIESVLGSKNALHNSYQDFQAFIDQGGRIGLQHDPLLYGAYNLNPFLIKWQYADMTVVEQGEVAVVKSYVGLPGVDVSSEDFSHGILVRPGHMGIWRSVLNTGKYPLVPRIYQIERVPTHIITLEWSNAPSEARELDSNLSTIHARSKESFEFDIDLHTQIVVPAEEAPMSISMCGTFRNLVDEVLQAAVGNHFRNKLQATPAVDFYEKREEVQAQATEHIRSQLATYHAQVPGVFIQDVVPDKKLSEILQARELANQQKATYVKQQEAAVARADMRKAEGRADAMADLAKSEIGVQTATNAASARKAQADGDAEYTRRTTAAEGLGLAEGLEAQKQAVGEVAAAMINAIKALPQGIKVVPDVMVSGGNDVMGILSAFVAQHMHSNTEKPAIQVHP
jgi:hypothetical protein